MGASRPTDARKAAAAPVWSETQNLFVGAGFIPPGEPCAAAGCGGMGASRPTDARVGCGCPVSRVMFGRFVGEGHAPPAGPCRTANIHGRAMALPYEPAQMPPPSGWCETQNLFVGADSISARGLAATQGSRDDLRPKSRACGPVGLRNAPAGAVRASSPTGVCCNAGPQLPGWPPHSPPSAGARAPKTKYHKRPAVPHFHRGRQAAHRILTLNSKL